jgi:DNA polymerase I-like protein with 3'-5' exonuclease and polymerase domains
VSRRAAAHRNPHVGGQQAPLFTPDSDWVPPAELPDLRRAPRLAVDTETRDEALAGGRGPGWARRAGYVAGVALSWDGGSLYAPINHPDTECFDADAVARWLRDHRHVRWVMHNAAYDIGWLRASLGVEPPEALDDTSAMAAMVDENRLSYSLDDLARWRGTPRKDDALLREAAAAYGVDAKGGLYLMPARYVGTYAAADCVATLALADSLAPIIDAEGTRDAYQLECDILPLTMEMTWRGIRVDIEAAERGMEVLWARRDEALRELGEKLGMTRPVSMEELGSVGWLERVHNDAKIPYPTTPKTGRGSFTAGSTGWMHKSPHWLPQLIVTADVANSAASKFLGTFVLDYAHSGRIHANINQFRSEEGGARSHRFSYSDPPLQQMPKRNADMAALVRRCFLPEEGEWWVDPDYSQQEYRLIVHFAEELGLRKARDAGDRYRENPRTDYHSMVAEMTGLDRKSAKDANFAKSFGAGVPKFAHMINRSLADAQQIMDQYDDLLPFVKEEAQVCQRLAEKRGYIRLLDGARSHFELWEPAYRRDLIGPAQSVGYMSHDAAQQWAANYEAEHGVTVRMKRAFTHKAMNRLIQGSAARQTKMAMRAMWREGIVPLIQMHDALGASVASEAEGERIATLMREVVELSIPSVVDTHYGATWGDALHAWADRGAAWTPGGQSLGPSRVNPR